MGDILLPPDGGEAFLRSAQASGYGMERHLIRPAAGAVISSELLNADLLEDMNELIPTDELYGRQMTGAQLLHRSLNDTLSRIEGFHRNHIPRFSVRVFESGRHGTTIHRNDPSITPWAIGVTLKGEAPFNVYGQQELPDDEVRRLVGDSSDPTPLDSMNAGPGSAWVLYTRDELVPHASGIVESPEQRELIIFYRYFFMDR